MSPSLDDFQQLVSISRTVRHGILHDAGRPAVSDASANLPDDSSATNTPTTVPILRTTPPNVAPAAKPRTNSPTRPPNCFILFRSSLKKTLDDPTIQQSDLSLIASQMWREFSPAEQKPWKDAAKIVKDEHAVKYPDYKFNPKASKKQKARRAAQIDDRKRKSRKPAAPAIAFEDLYPEPKTRPISPSRSLSSSPLPITPPSLDSSIPILKSSEDVNPALNHDNWAPCDLVPGPSFFAPQFAPLSVSSSSSPYSSSASTPASLDTALPQVDMSRQYSNSDLLSYQLGVSSMCHSTNTIAYIPDSSCENNWYDPYGCSNIVDQSSVMMDCGITTV